MAACAVIIVGALLGGALDLVGLHLVGAEDEEEDGQQDEAVVEAEYHSQREYLGAQDEKIRLQDQKQIYIL